MTTRDHSEVLNDDPHMERHHKKNWRDPLVLCGCIATAGALASGFSAFLEVDPIKSQKMMRTRVAIQAATVALMAGAVYFSGTS